MRFSKEIRALAKKIAKAEFDFANLMYREEVQDARADKYRLDFTEREYVAGAVDNVGALITDEITSLLGEVADKEYNRLVKAKYGRKK